MAPVAHPVIPLPYGTVLFPGKTLNISPQGREDVIAIIGKYYSGALQTRTKDSSPLVACVPLCSPFISPDGKRLLEDAPPKAPGQKQSLPDVHTATTEDLYRYGCLAKIVGVRGGRRGEVALIVEGVNRCEVETYTRNRPYFEANVKEIRDFVDVWDPAIKGNFAHLKELSKELFQIVRMSSVIHADSGLSPLLLRQLESFVARKDVSDSGFLADFMAVLGQCTFEDKLWLLAATSVAARLQRANELVSNQIKALASNTKILVVNNSENNSNVDPEKIKQMQKNGLRARNGVPPAGFKMPPGMPGGGNNEEEDELQEITKKLEDAGLSEEAGKAATRELKRLAKMNPAQAEYSVIRNYLENLAEIPWTKMTEDNLNASTLAKARQQLDDDHYGLEKIKKRLLEYLAVLKLKQTANNALEAQIKTIADRDAKIHEEKQKKEQAAKKESKQIEAKDSKRSKVDEKQQEQQQPPVPVPESDEMKQLKSQKRVDKSPILLLVGPPGVGKTSLAKSVATALGRKFHRISLGGVRDEAEIRGHRRTYVAAMPGVIVNGLKKVGTANPVILLDEIDKVGTSSFHGDPSAAMLEVLDPEQNHTFMDHYVNIPIDLSKVLFIATANSLDTIPAPLLDRMETIQLSGYTTVEKRHIALRHLLPKQITSNGMQGDNVELPSDVIDKIITSYTRESGVRNLEREIGSVCRYKAVQYAEAQDTTSDSSSTSITTSVHKSEGTTSTATYNPLVHIDELEDILGIERFTDELASKDPPRPGVVTGLVAFAQLGQGSILFIEIADMPGKGRVQLTGKLGDVLKESVEVALSWVKSHAFDLGISGSPDEDIMSRRSIHVHCPAGAVPKDGPSAGLAHTVALISLFKGLPVPPTLAMTGEVSLRGKVTPVGGIKEKLIGAHRAGVKTVLLPKENRKEVKDVPEEVRRELDICFVGDIWEALRLVWPEERWVGGSWVESRL